MKKNLTKIAAVASLATVLTPVVASANSVSTDIDHALRLEQTAHADGTQNDRIDWTGVTNTNLKDDGGYVYGAGTKVARSKQQGNYWLYLAETGTGAVHYGEVPQEYVTPTGQVTNHLDDYGSTVVINNSLRSNDSMAGELSPTNAPATQTGSNNNYQEGNNSAASSSSASSAAQPGHDASGAVTGNQNASSTSSEAKPSTSVADGSTSATGSTASTNAQTGHDVSGAVTGNQSSSASSAQGTQAAKPAAGASSASSTSQAKPAGQASSASQPGHDISGAVTGVAGNHDNGGATASSASSQKPAANTSSASSQTPKPTTGASTGVSDKTAANIAYSRGVDPLTDKALKDETPTQQKQAKAYVDALNAGKSVADAKKAAGVKADDVKTDAVKADANKAQAGHHVVAAGETLSGIAKANGTTVGAIVKANPSITNPASVKVGTDLVMPAANGGQAVAPQGQSVAKAAPAATSQAQGSQAKASEKAAPAKGELLKTGAQDNEKGAVIASMSAVAGLVGLAALNRKKKFNY